MEEHTDIFRDAKDTDVIILDPPRAGLQKQVLNAIRRTPVQKIVYVSCNPKSLAADMYGLCAIDCVKEGGEKKYLSTPFYPAGIRLFNMFPGCEHVETIMLFQRCSDFQGVIRKTD